MSVHAKLYLPLEIMSGEYFNERGICLPYFFFVFSPLNMDVFKSFLEAILVIWGEDRIGKHLFGLTLSNILTLALISARGLYSEHISSLQMFLIKVWSDKSPMYMMEKGGFAEHQLMAMDVLSFYLDRYAFLSLDMAI